MLTAEQKKEFKKAFTHTFQVLREMNIVAHPYMDICCQTCGTSIIDGQIKNLEANGLDKAGYAFTHKQDRSSKNGSTWLDKGEIYVTYGCSGDSDDKSEDIGKLIVAVAKYCGLVTEWNGSLYTRILIKFPV